MKQTKLIFLFLICFEALSVQAQWTSNGETTLQTSTIDNVLIGGSSTSGTGTKCYWNYNKKAFRGGGLLTGSTYWDTDSLALYSFSYAEDTRAIGDYSFSFGTKSQARGLASFAFGSLSIANGAASTAFGLETKATGDLSTSFGELTEATGNQATAFGNESIASGTTSTAFGYKTEASGFASIAFGYNSIASGHRSTAFGTSAIASGDGSTAFSEESVASGDRSTAFGEESVASGSNSTAFGVSTEASGYASTAFGYDSEAHGTYSTAFGFGSIAIQDYSTAIGKYTLTNAIESIILGTGVSLSEPLKNNIDNSLMIGFGSTTPTFFIGPASSSSGTGNVSIGGNTSPSQKLDISGAIKIGNTGINTNGSIRYNGSNFQGYHNGVWKNLDGTGGSSVWNLTGVDAYYNSGNVGIGTSNPNHLLHVAGDVAVAGSIVAPSDRRLKEDIQPITDALKIVSALQPKTYNYKDEQIATHGLSDKQQYGLIAQELEEILPTLISQQAIVAEDGTTYKGVEYAQLIPILTQAIKELSKENVKLREDNMELRADNRALKTTTQSNTRRLEALEKSVVKN